MTTTSTTVHVETDVILARLNALPEEATLSERRDCVTLARLLGDGASADAAAALIVSTSQSLKSVDEGMEADRLADRELVAAQRRQIVMSLRQVTAMRPTTEDEILAKARIWGKTKRLVKKAL